MTGSRLSILQKNTSTPVFVHRKPMARPAGYNAPQRQKGTAIRPLSLLAAIVLTPMLPTGPAFSNDIISKLGEPRRNVTTRARSVDEVSHQLARTYPGVTGVIPLMIFPSNSLVVENAFKALASSTTCRSILADYDRRLRAQHGDKIRHGLYCVSIADGKLKSIDTIAKSF